MNIKEQWKSLAAWVIIFSVAVCLMIYFALTPPAHGAEPTNTTEITYGLTVCTMSNCHQTRTVTVHSETSTYIWHERRHIHTAMETLSTTDPFPVPTHWSKWRLVWAEVIPAR